MHGVWDAFLAVLHSTPPLSEAKREVRQLQLIDGLSQTYSAKREDSLVLDATSRGSWLEDEIQMIRMKYGFHYKI